MRRGRTLIFVFLIIIIIAGGGGFLLYNQYRTSQQATSAQPTYVEVYIAGQNIAQGARITPDLLTTIKIAQENVIQGMYRLEDQQPLWERLPSSHLTKGL